MTLTLSFFIEAALMGVALAMDAFSVSLANGFNETKMKVRRMCLIAGTFAFYQFAMPMIGWFCVHTIREKFIKFQSFIPWIALVLLLYIGGKMLIDGIRNKDEGEEESTGVGFMALMVQGVATSIDALSVGFTIDSYGVKEALVESIIIAVVTFAICIGGLIIGKKFGTKLAGKATILGGVILIGIGLKIFIEGVILK